MKTLLGYAFLILFGAPALVGIPLAIFDFDKAKQGRQNILLTIIAIVISIGLFFISLIHKDYVASTKPQTLNKW